jgi:flagellar hook-length control protein FliK
MTSVGPDLLLPGVASKKPAPASDGEAKSPSHEGGGDTGFAQELDAVMTPAPTAAASATDTAPSETPSAGISAVGTPSEELPSVLPAPGASPGTLPTEVVTPVDPTEFHLFGPGSQAPTPMTLQQQPPVEGIAPAAVDELASLMTVQEAPAEGTPPGSNVAAGVPTPEPTPLVSQTAAGTPDGNHLLATVAGVNGISGPGLMGQGQSASAAPSTPSQTSPNQGPNPTVLAASLAVDPRALPSGNPDGHQNSHLPNNDKAALRTAASLTTDSKPNEPAGGQSFSNTLNAAATETAGQSARGAAQAAAQRPARPAQTAPPTAQIAVHIVRAVGDGISRFNVQLQPAELGRVEVKLEVNREGAVRAMVTAERQETVDQLQRDSRALERALQDAGLKTDSQNLQFSLRGGQNGRGLSENRTSIGNSGDADIAEVSESALAAHWSNVAGSTGALDIRV